MSRPKNRGLEKAALIRLFAGDFRFRSTGFCGDVDTPVAELDFEISGRFRRLCARHDRLACPHHGITADQGFFVANRATHTVERVDFFGRAGNPGSESRIKFGRQGIKIFTLSRDFLKERRGSEPCRL